jgi:hypothetical protein
MGYPSPDPDSAVQTLINFCILFGFIDASCMLHSQIDHVMVA